MKNRILFTAFSLCAAIFTTLPLYAEEARVSPAQADQNRIALLRKAQAEKAAAEKEAQQTVVAIRQDRNKLQSAVNQLTAKKAQLEQSIASLQQEEQVNSAKETDLDQKLLETEGMVKELVGQIRINAKDLDELVSQAPQYALEENISNSMGEAKNADSLSFLTAVAGDEKFPGMADIRAMSDALLDIIRRSGEVNLTQAHIISREGKESEVNVLLAGPFTSLYIDNAESGFLGFTPGNRKLYALANLPSSSMQKQIESYMSGNSPSMPIDISRGGALRQISHRVSFLEQIQQGGPIVYPILALLVLGLLIVVERVFYLLRTRQAKPPLISYIRQLAAAGNWDGAKKLCESGKWRKKPMGRVLASGLAVRSLPREDVENALHEAILAEVPKLERGLSTLSMFTAIAPLLGLLGTVTGMINVFHVITLYGASDPRMMSSGISEALVTTMLGLSVAIPLMLLHNMVSRGVDHNIGDLEEQSVSLVNLIFKERA